MPAGYGALGFAYFAAAKFAGYTSFCRWGVQPAAEKSSHGESGIPSAWWAGAARTLIGVTTGATVILGFWSISWWGRHETAASVLFWTLLVPVRTGEWWLLLRWVYGKGRFGRGATVELVGAGIAVSFALDLLGIVAAWVCRAESGCAENLHNSSEYSPSRRIAGNPELPGRVQGGIVISASPTNQALPVKMPSPGALG